MTATAGQGGSGPTGSRFIIWIRPTCSVSYVKLARPLTGFTPTASSRCSCSFCILASRADLRRAAELRPDLHRRYARARAPHRPHPFAHAPAAPGIDRHPGRTRRRGHSIPLTATLSRPAPVPLSHRSALSFPGRLNPSRASAIRDATQDATPYRREPESGLSGPTPVARREFPHARGVAPTPEETDAHLSERRSLRFPPHPEPHGERSATSSPLAVPLSAGPWSFSSSEALYQAAKFAAHVDVQQRIAEAATAREAAAMRRTPGLGIDPDWNAQRVDVMRWVLRMKREANAREIDAVLAATGNRPIVEVSTRDPWWGAARR